MNKVTNLIIIVLCITLAIAVYLIYTNQGKLIEIVSKVSKNTINLRDRLDAIESKKKELTNIKVKTTKNSGKDKNKQTASK